MYIENYTQRYKDYTKKWSMIFAAIVLAISAAWFAFKCPCSVVILALHVIGTHFVLCVCRSLICDKGNKHIELLMMQYRHLESEETRQRHWKAIREFRKENLNVIYHVASMVSLFFVFLLEYMFIDWIK